MTTERIAPRDPMSSTSTLTQEQRTRLQAQPAWLTALLEEELLARLLLSVTPSVTGKAVPS